MYMKNQKPRREMSKKLLKLVVAIVIIASSKTLFSTSELRSPLSLNSRLNNIGGFSHYPLDPVGCDSLWSVDFWGGFYFRKAHCGMAPRGCDSCTLASRGLVGKGSSCGYCAPPSCCFNDCCGCCPPGPIYDGYCNSLGPCCHDEDLCDSRTVPLSTLFFGKSEFRGEEAFAGGILINRPSGSPGLSFAKLRPRFDYNERGVVLGMHFEKRPECKKWRFGFNFTLPIKSIEIEQNSDCCCEETLGDVMCIERAHLVPADGDSTCGTDGKLGEQAYAEGWSYRLDFLTSLYMPNGEPLVQYEDGNIKIAGFPTNYNCPPQATVVFRKRPDCTCYYCTSVEPCDSSLTWPLYNPDNGREPNVVTPLPGDGCTGLSTNQVARTVDDQDYTMLAMDRCAQASLFVMPFYNNAPEGEGFVYIQPNAQVMKDIIDDIVNYLDFTGKASASHFFSQRGVCLCKNEYVCGLGDFDTDFYVGYDFDERSFLEFVVSLRLPTGKKNKNPGRVFYQPTGNNGHVETKVGFAGGRRTKRWFGFSADVVYSHVFEACEKRAAAFRCAQIKNIGPCVDAKVKWGYFLAHADFTLFHPENQNMGFALGYEFYYKKKDDICFCFCDKDPRVKDFLGEFHELDARLLSMNTDVATHKIRGEFFHRWCYFEIYGGASKVLGGWNGMRETEAHIGFDIYF